MSPFCYVRAVATQIASMRCRALARLFIPLQLHCVSWPDESIRCHADASLNFTPLFLCPSSLCVSFSFQLKARPRPFVAILLHSSALRAQAVPFRFVASSCVSNAVSSLHILRQSLLRGGLLRLLETVQRSAAALQFKSLAQPIRASPKPFLSLRFLCVTDLSISDALLIASAQFSAPPQPFLSGLRQSSSFLCCSCANLFISLASHATAVPKHLSSEPFRSISQPCLCFSQLCFALAVQFHSERCLSDS